MIDSTRLQFEWTKRTLIFRFDAGTSRGILKTRDVYWIKVFQPGDLSGIGWGESAPLPKLSLDDREDFESNLTQILEGFSGLDWHLDPVQILTRIKDLVPMEWPSIRFGVEVGLLDYFYGGLKRIIPCHFRDSFEPISINGLVWMGDRHFMLDQINQKLEEGFDCIKMKIGAIEFSQELELLSYIRSKFDSGQVTLRVDANGAFPARDVMAKLEALAKLGIHSIEQPIAQGDWDAMAKLCKDTPLPIALDEELIGVSDKGALLDTVQPQHIILKPTLLGGILETQEWVQLAEERGIGWWLTSALESNIGLNAICQLASSFSPVIPQGLGTGKLFHNNLVSPLEVSQGRIHYRKNENWENPS